MANYSIDATNKSIGLAVTHKLSLQLYNEADATCLQ
jgi:hypothetical protein